MEGFVQRLKELQGEAEKAIEAPKTSEVERRLIHKFVQHIIKNDLVCGPQDKDFCANLIL